MWTAECRLFTPQWNVVTRYTTTRNSIAIRRKDVDYSLNLGRMSKQVQTVGCQNKNEVFYCMLETTKKVAIWQIVLSLNEVITWVFWPEICTSLEVDNCQLPPSFYYIFVGSQHVSKAQSSDTLLGETCQESWPLICVWVSQREREMDVRVYPRSLAFALLDEIEQ